MSRSRCLDGMLLLSVFGSLPLVVFISRLQSYDPEYKMFEWTMDSFKFDGRQVISAANLQTSPCSLLMIVRLHQ
jgi:hypothetical protein